MTQVPSIEIFLEMRLPVRHILGGVVEYMPPPHLHPFGMPGSGNSFLKMGKNMLYVCVCMCIFTYIYIYGEMIIYVYICVYIEIYIYIHIYIYICCFFVQTYAISSTQLYLSQQRMQVAKHIV